MIDNDIIMQDRAIHNFGRLPIAILILVLFAISPMTIHAESILLHEILDRLGLQPTIPELDQVKKGGSLTAAIQNPAELAALGFTKLKPSRRVHIQNLGDHFWLITYPPSGQKAKIQISRQNQPVKKPRIRIKLISLIPG